MNLRRVHLENKIPYFVFLKCRTFNDNMQYTYSLKRLTLMITFSLVAVVGNMVCNEHVFLPNGHLPCTIQSDTNK